jgi:hypothetical protein
VPRGSLVPRPVAHSGDCSILEVPRRRRRPARGRRPPGRGGPQAPVTVRLPIRARPCAGWRCSKTEGRWRVPVQDQPRVRCVFHRSWTVIPGHRGRRWGFGGERRRFFSDVHDELMARRFRCRRRQLSVSAFGILWRSVQRERLAQRLAFGFQLDPMTVMDDSVQDGVRQSGFTQIRMPCIHG